MGGSREQKGRKIGKKREIKAKANQLEAKERKKGSEEKLKRKGSSMNKNQLKITMWMRGRGTDRPAQGDRKGIVVSSVEPIRVVLLVAQFATGTTCWPN